MQQAPHSEAAKNVMLREKKDKNCTTLQEEILQKMLHLSCSGGIFPLNIFHIFLMQTAYKASTKNIHRVTRTTFKLCAQMSKSNQLQTELLHLTSLYHAMTFWSLVYISLHSCSNPDPVTLKATLGIQPGKESCKSNKVDSSIRASATHFF